MILPINSYFFSSIFLVHIKQLHQFSLLLPCKRHFWQVQTPDWWNNFSILLIKDFHERCFAHSFLRLVPTVKPYEIMQICQCTSFLGYHWSFKWSSLQIFYGISFCHTCIDTTSFIVCSSCFSRCCNTENLNFFTVTVIVRALLFYIIIVSIAYF